MAKLNLRAIKSNKERKEEIKNLYWKLLSFKLLQELLERFFLPFERVEFINKRAKVDNEDDIDCFHNKS